MKTKLTSNAANAAGCPQHAGERGAALVAALLVATFLLVVGVTLIFVTSMASTTAIDATAESQAYYAAEAGMQETLNLLRGNAAGLPISFKDAAVRVTSNKADDPTPNPRLSKWLTYSYPTSQPDRVPLTASYSPLNGMAYSVRIIAPDVPTANPTPTPDPTFIDNPVAHNLPKPTPPWWHPWHCAHCQWDYSHCRLWPNGVVDRTGSGCAHSHCIPPASGQLRPGDDGYQRLIVQVTGYGPKGARKDLQLLVRRTALFYYPEAMILMRGTATGGGITLQVATGNTTVFDGKDTARSDTHDVAVFGFTSNADWDEANPSLTYLETYLTNSAVIGKVKADQAEYLTSNADPFLSEIPDWLSSATASRSLVSDLKNVATTSGRYYTPGSLPATNNRGTDTAALFTFIDGDYTLTGTGGGLLVVTGNLTLDGTLRWDGLILVLGNGTVTRSTSGGTATLNGAMAIAKFDSTGDYLAPTFNTNAGGPVVMKYDTQEIADAIETVGLRVLGVREF